MLKVFRFEMVEFQLRVFGHIDNQNLLFPSQGHSNHVSNVGLSETFIISTCLSV